MEPHSTDYNQILLEDYRWKSFSIYESIKYKLHLFFVWLFCTFFQSHDWIILINPWTFSDITTVEEFRKYRAKLLMCSCCKKTKHINEANLTYAQMFSYKHYTYKYFKYNG